eukprot:768446-Hanusia_phi.AAC.7
MEPNEKPLNEAKISVRQYIEIIAKWRMSRVKTQWPPIVQTENAIVSRVAVQGQERVWVKHNRRDCKQSTAPDLDFTLTSLIVILSFSVNNGLTKVQCVGGPVADDQASITRAEQELRASQALTFVPCEKIAWLKKGGTNSCLRWLRDELMVITARARTR